MSSRRSRYNFGLTLEEVEDLRPKGDVRTEEGHSAHKE